jgi:hypothetical protein
MVRIRFREKRGPCDFACTHGTPDSFFRAVWRECHGHGDFRNASRCYCRCLHPCLMWTTPHRTRAHFVVFYLLHYYPYMSAHYSVCSFARYLRPLQGNVGGGYFLQNFRLRVSLCYTYVGELLQMNNHCSTECVSQARTPSEVPFKGAWLTNTRA